MPAGLAAPATRKDPILSSVASFFVPGLGTIINGRSGRGFTILGLAVLSLVGLFACALLALFVMSSAVLQLFPVVAMAPGIWVWGMIDAYQFATEHNRRYGLRLQFGRTRVWCRPSGCREGRLQVMRRRRRLG